jgi:acyl-CoA thioesterase I
MNLWRIAWRSVVGIVGVARSVLVVRAIAAGLVVGVAAHANGLPVSGPASTPAGSPVRIVFLGDSLTAGYGLEPDEAYPARVGALLAADGRAVTVVNAGLSGDTSAGGLRRVAWVMRQPVDILVVALGANDALRGLDTAATRTNLRAIIHQARAARPQIRVVLAGMLAPPNMGADYQAEFAAIYPELAAAEQCSLLPFLLDGVAGDPSKNLADGIHPNTAGQQMVAELVAAVLRPLLEG